jgi:hypothetical protein
MIPMLVSRDWMPGRTRGYGEENVAFLKRVAGEVDPGRVFQRLEKGEFKCREVLGAGRGLHT